MKALLQKLFKGVPMPTIVCALQTPVYFVGVVGLVATGWVDVTYNSGSMKWTGIGLLGVLVLTLSLRAMRKWRKQFMGTKSAIAVGHFSVFQCALMAIGSGCFEEVLFRGFLQPHLGLVVTSVLFGLIHWDKAMKKYMVLAAGAGLFLGWLTIASGSLLPAIIVHVVNNFVGFLLARRDRANLKEDARAWGKMIAQKRKEADLLTKGWEDVNKGLADSLEKVKELQGQVCYAWLPQARFYLIKEWDDTVNKVEVVGVDRDTESVTLKYDDGVTHTVSAQYFRSVEHKALPC